MAAWGNWEVSRAPHVMGSQNSRPIPQFSEVLRPGVGGHCIRSAPTPEAGASLLGASMSSWQAQASKILKPPSPWQKAPLAVTQVLSLGRGTTEEMMLSSHSQAGHGPNFSCQLTAICQSYFKSPKYEKKISNLILKA